MHRSRRLRISDIPISLAFTGSQSRALQRTLAMLESICAPDAAFFHGSFTRGMHDKLSDIDIIVIVPSARAARAVCQHLVPLLQRNGGIDLWHYTERYPWFGRLLSLQFGSGRPVLIELGVVAREELKRFFVEPDAVILYDRTGAVARRKARCIRERRRVAAQFTSSEFDAVHLLDKMLASLCRSRLWNAFEIVNLLRRLFIELWRRRYDPHYALHVGRPERNAEDILPKHLLHWLEGTIPSFTASSLGLTAVRLVDRMCRMRLLPASPRVLLRCRRIRRVARADSATAMPSAAHSARHISVGRESDSAQRISRFA